MLFRLFYLIIVWIILLSNINFLHYSQCGNLCKPGCMTECTFVNCSFAPSFTICRECFNLCYTWLRTWQLKCSILIHQVRPVQKGNNISLYISSITIYIHWILCNLVMMKFVWVKKKFSLLMNYAKMLNIIDVLISELLHRSLRGHLLQVRFFLFIFLIT